MEKLNIGKGLRRARFQSGLSQQDLAEIARVSFRVINHYVNSRIIPRADRLETLAKALGKL